MSPAFDVVLSNIIRDPQFAQKLKEDPENVLAPYALSNEEATILSGLDESLLSALRQRETNAEPTRGWLQPANFREAGAGVLSLLLILLLVYTVFATLAQMNTAPITYQVNDTELVVDPFERAKDLLGIIFPLFGAVVTFWLGVSVEGRRADKNEEEAQRERDEKVVESVKKEVALQDAAESRTIALDAIDQAESVMLEMQQEVAEADFGSEDYGAESTLSVDEESGSPASSAPTADAQQVQNALDKLRASRKKLMK
ncbi:MAG: hypothetical protein AAF633_10265 [Chloroflexota bacterium]